MILRDYQKRISDSVFDCWKEFVSTLVVAPTGTGKTIVFSDVARRLFPRRTMVVVHRQELAWQARDKIQALTGMRVAVEMGDYKANMDKSFFGHTSVIVASIQTLTSGGDGGGRMGKFDPNDFAALIVDEAHHATSASYRRFFQYCRSNPKLKMLGVTATPDRADEEALGQVFDSVAFDYEILDAIKDGWLVPVFQQMVNVDVDFSTIRTTAGDLNGADLAAIMEQEKNLHSIAGPTLEIVGNKRTLVFTSSVKHAEMLSEIFNRHKPGSSAWVCGKTDPDDRMRINNDFHNDKIQILCNCGTHTEGFDSHGIAVVVMARPTKSRSLYAQMVGRATRPLPDVVDGCPNNSSVRRAAIARSAKPGCLVVDFVGNAGRHKLMTSADILGGNVSDEAVENAIKSARMSGRPVRMAESLEEEEEKLKQREARRLADEARRANVTARTSFTTKTVDPFDVLQVQPVKSRGWDSGKTLSEKQRGFLKRQGINPDSLEYAKARQLIGEMIFRLEKKLCTYGQAKVLRKFGIKPDMSFELASATIDAIAKNGWRKPATLPQPKPVEVEDAVPF